MTDPQHTPTQNFPQEEWRECPDYEGIYEVSSLGRLRRSIGGAGARSGHIHTPNVERNGYLLVCLSKAGKATTLRLHRLVARAFHGPIPDGMEVHHRDHDRANAAAANLEYVTSSQNKHLATLAHGSYRGERQAGCKLTEDAVRAIRADYVAGSGSYRQLAQQHGVTKEAVYLLVKRRNWKHVA